MNRRQFWCNGCNASQMCSFWRERALTFPSYSAPIVSWPQTVLLTRMKDQISVARPMNTWCLPVAVGCARFPESSAIILQLVAGGSAPQIEACQRWPFSLTPLLPVGVARRCVWPSCMVVTTPVNFCSTTKRARNCRRLIAPRGVRPAAPRCLGDRSSQTCQSVLSASKVTKKRAPTPSYICVGGQ